MSVTLTTMHSVQASKLTFTGSDALGPGMINGFIASISALLEPSTTASAAAKISRLFHNCTLGAPLRTSRGRICRRQRCCGHADLNVASDIAVDTRIEHPSSYTRKRTPRKTHTPENLTFACLNALEPSMVIIQVASISALLEPITTASTATEFTRFLYNAALGAPFAAYCGSYCLRGFYGHAITIALA